MIIYLLGKEIGLVKVEDNAEKLDTNAAGLAAYDENKAYFNGNDSYQTCLHEIFHFYIYRIGLRQQQSYTKEIACDLFAACISQLMAENGNDILERIKSFANTREV